MKKIALSMMVLLLILVGCSRALVDHEVKTSEILEKVANDDSFILYIGSKECSVCTEFAPTYQEIAAEYPEVMYSIELINAVSNDTEDFETLQDDVIGKVTVTPSIYVIKDGVVVDKATGAVKYSKLETFISTYDLNK